MASKTDSEIRKKVIFSILGFLNDERNSGHFSADELESIEVAHQCLESVYDISLTGTNDRKLYHHDTPLLQMFQSTVKDTAAVSKEDQQKAEVLKNEGNELMQKGEFQEAIGKYTSAIYLDPKSAIYYCNRAAAHSKLNEHNKAIDDCLRALQIDSDYSKAHGRLGLAYSALNQHDNAVKAYSKALELDPDSVTYQENLKLAQKQQMTAQATANPTFGGQSIGNLMSSPAIGQVLNNPALMEMATRFMNDPGVMNTFTNMMSNNAGGGGGGMDQLWQMGQQIAEQIQQQSPEEVERIREQLSQNRQNNSNE